MALELHEKERLLLYGSNLWYLGDGMLGPLFAVFAERVGGNVLDISWAWATYLIVTGTCIILVGKFSDGARRKERFLVAGYILNILFTFSYLLVESPAGLFVVQSGLGVALALSSPTWSALYSKYQTKKHAGYIWGLANGEAQLITGLALLIGGLIVNYLSFDVLFITMGIIQIISTMYIVRILKFK